MTDEEKQRESRKFFEMIDYIETAEVWDFNRNNCETFNTAYVNSVMNGDKNILKKWFANVLKDFKT